MTVTLTLIAVTGFISIIALYINPKVMDLGMLRPYRTVRDGTWYEVITSGFLHAGIGHLLVNMFVLFFFGVVIEQTIGTYHYLALYFSGLVFSAIPSLVRHRENPNYATLGASGAVESVLFGFIFLYPTEKIVIILLPIPIPAWIFGILFLLYSVFESKREGGNVNHEAHIAGAIWGILYMIFFIPNSVDHILTLFGLI
ncbi:rhomboid family intramembrane serine protease [Rhodohalobacter sp.]|uniref:rhomboid family intramembrane serine protease n=1 Tax=Rhodohalobacter sp. TaxID=1974210 RepID=UPI002ACDC078|nr:rhomboid family intramembrane serine protease [Rhodohalobacter sp.]MDZ7755353.1 rhomboid family intramembrane serine protease [Rhodohalobacter sp.]